jgi:hypothetical protein
MSKNFMMPSTSRKRAGNAVRRRPAQSQRLDMGSEFEADSDA